MKPARAVATIPENLPFLQEIARFLLAENAGGQATLPETLVLLPNRRACRSLREAFLALGEGKPMLLPRILPIGELDEEAALFGDIAQNLAEIGELPPVIASMRRHFLLTQLVLRFERSRTGRVYTVDQSSALAQQLARFIDEVARYGLDFSALDRLVPEELATHWQQTLHFLHIVSQQWPQLLEGEGAVDAVSQRQSMLSALISAWQKNPPTSRIIAAGSTGSQPATARLLAAISQLPAGLVVLPALDKEMGQEEWKQIGETHPQYALKQLLEFMELPREQVRYLGEHHASARVQLLRSAFAPPLATTDWRTLELPLEEGCKGLGFINTESALDEARCIAVALREVLETPAKTAALVTPDRTLARMVAAQMQRFGVQLDDSAGRRLSAAPAASFLRLSIQMVASRAAPVDVLALLRHPLAALGKPTAQCRLFSRQLELSLLRGVRVEGGFSALKQAALANPEGRYPLVDELLAWLEKEAHPLASLLASRADVPLADLLREHLRFVEQLASTDTQAGEVRLWAGEDGHALAAHLADIMRHADALGSIDPMAYPALLEALLEQGSYWPSFGQHPRLHILSPMEARLQRYDMVILGGLNEGVWPALPAADPWLSRPMRTQFGLPPVERDIGQSAHDLYQLCAAPEVLLTRARKKDGAPTVASRWLVRLQTLIGGHRPDLLEGLDRSAHFEVLRQGLEAPTPLPPLERPQPVPPLSARPRQMSVTAVDSWLADPYIIYARSILRLRKLDRLDKEPDSSDFGQIAHNALEDFVREYPHYLPAHPLQELLACGKTAFAPMMDRPAVACLWWPRFEAIASWFIDQEQKRRRSISDIIVEREGLWKIESEGGTFTLKTRIDRMEMDRSGTATVIDYKTGTVVSKSKLEKGEANQLPLGALVAQYGQLQPALEHPLRVAQLEYWKLAGSAAKCEILSVEAPALMEAAKQRLEALIREFDDPATPYAAQRNTQMAYNDFEHLTRRQEWEAF